MYDQEGLNIDSGNREIDRQKWKKKDLAGPSSLHGHHGLRLLGVHALPFGHVPVVCGWGHLGHLPSMRWTSGCPDRRDSNRLCGWVLNAVLVDGVCGGCR